jgi:translation initiation factor IF-1
VLLEAREGDVSGRKLTWSMDVPQKAHRSEMPRNTLGGSRAKRQGNKHSGGGGGGSSGPYAGVRRAAKDEMYAVVTRVYGGGRAHVIGNDGIHRRLEIRGKFKGRNRRHNEVKVGGLILVGDRAWTINASGANQQERVCDLLCVYDAEEIRTLRREGKLKLEMFREATSKFEPGGGDDGVTFDNTGGSHRGGGDREPAAKSDDFDPYAGMPAFSDEEGSEDEAPAKIAEAPVASAAPAGPRGLFENDDEVDPDDI